MSETTLTLICITYFGLIFICLGGIAFVSMLFINDLRRVTLNEEYDDPTQIVSFIREYLPRHAKWNLSFVSALVSTILVGGVTVMLVITYSLPHSQKAVFDKAFGPSWALWSLLVVVAFGLYSFAKIAWGAWLSYRSLELRFPKHFRLKDK